MEYTKSAEIKALSHSPRVTVLGLGNMLLSDEGVGIHIVQRLDGIMDEFDVDLIDGGTSPDALPLVGSVEKLIIVDAVKAGNEPGTMYRLSCDDLASDPADHVSLHEIGVLDSLKMVTLLDRQPKSTVIIGIEPKIIDYGLELSSEVEEKLPEVINLILKEVEETNTAMEVDR